MGFLTPLFKAAAEKRAAKRHQIYLEEQARYDKRQEKVTSLNKRLTDIVNSYAEDLEKSKCHLKVGDEATLNIYDFDRPTRNGWDGGPNMLLGYITQKEELPDMPVFKIESIYVDKSLAFEKIENFLKNIDDYELNVYAMQNNHALEIAYSAYLGSREVSAVFGKFGLYKTAKFSSTYKFQPSWGLNVNAFLVLGTPAAIRTQEIYRMITKRHNMWKEHNEFSKEVDLFIKQSTLDFPF
jgi:hypothetical protein